jgi:Uncharacterised nucleotidyltransferase
VTSARRPPRPLRPRRPDGVCWPDAAQELLLKAALTSGAAAVEAWRSWQGSVALEDVDPGSFRLLPLVYRNLTSQGRDPDELGKLRGVFRQSWCRHQVAVRALAGALRALHGAGADAIVLKGAALALLCYRDPGVRPMKDVDLLVPPERRAAAVGAVEGLGWRGLEMADRAATAEMHFRAGGGPELDLHWYLLPFDCYPGADDDLRPAAVPLDVEGVAAKALGPADQLFHVLAHGIAWNQVPQIRWVADAVVVIRSAGSGLDWDRLLEQSARRGFVPAVRSGLEYLRGTFEVDVPAGVLRRAAAIPVSRASRFERWATERGPLTPLGWAPTLWCSYVRTLRGGGLKPGLAGFVRFLRARIRAGNAFAFGVLLAWKALRSPARLIRRLAIGPGSPGAHAGRHAARG